jgi:hypothetical protein
LRCYASFLLELRDERGGKIGGGIRRHECEAKGWVPG